MARRVSLTPDALDYSIYGDNSKFVRSYLDKQLGEMGGRSRGTDDYVFNAVKAGIDYVNDRVRIHRLQDELARNGMRNFEDKFYALFGLDRLRSANPEMQRWIMSHPRVRKMYLDQDLDGYSNTYKTDIKGIGKDDYDYRLATHGMIVDIDDDESEVVFYIGDFKHGDRKLTLREKVLIQQSWRSVDLQFDKSDYDFTNPTGEITKMNK